MANPPAAATAPELAGKPPLAERSLLDANQAGELVRLAFEGAVTERTVDQHVKDLRRKLGTHGQFIETVRGLGYRFAPPD